MVDKQLGKGLADIFWWFGLVLCNRWQTAEGKGKLLLKATSVLRVLDQPTAAETGNMEENDCNIYMCKETVEQMFPQNYQQNIFKVS